MFKVFIWIILYERKRGEMINSTLTQIWPLEFMLYLHKSSSQQSIDKTVWKTRCIAEKYLQISELFLGIPRCGDPIPVHRTVYM